MENPKNGTELSFDRPIIENQFCRVIKQTIENYIYSIYISGEIPETFYYTKMYATLREVSETDLVNIYINSNGGNVTTAFQIITAINSCKAKKNVHLDGSVDSAASLIVLGGFFQNFIISPLASMCVHNYSRGLWGKGHEIKQDLDFHFDFFKEKFTKIYKGFMTLEEISQLFDGKDFWFNSTQIEARLKKRTELIQREATIKSTKTVEKTPKKSPKTTKK